MSFFDEDDEPRTRVRPRRAAPAQGAAPPDRRTVLIRQGILFGGFVVLALVVIFAVRACQSSAKKTALRDYNRDVSRIVRESDSQVSQPFFELLRDPGSESAADLATTINGYRGQAEQQYEQTRRLDVPDEMAAAQRSFLITMESRRDGLASIAGQVRSALSDDADAAEAAVGRIAGAMQLFLTSDVVHEWRTLRFMQEELREAEVTGQQLQRTRFLPGVEWLDESTVGRVLGTQGSGGNGGGRGEPAPGLHGTGLMSVRVGDVTLEPGAANRIPAAEREFVVTFANQGENDETDVQVVVRIEGVGTKAIRVVRTVDSVPQGQQAEASLALEDPLPAGQTVTIKVEVKPVPGEEKTDNNSAQYEALVTQ